MESAKEILFWDGFSNPCCFYKQVFINTLVVGTSFYTSLYSTIIHCALDWLGTYLFHDVQDWSVIIQRLWDHSIVCISVQHIWGTKLLIVWSLMTSVFKCSSLITDHWQAIGLENIHLHWFNSTDSNPLKNPPLCQLQL